MKIGDLVRSFCARQDIGIIVRQERDIDRWVILWADGYETIYWGSSFEVINGDR